MISASRANSIARKVLDSRTHEVLMDEIENIITVAAQNGEFSVTVYNGLSVFQQEALDKLGFRLIYNSVSPAIIIRWNTVHA